MNDKLLSISIAAYNVEDYLAEALDSLMKAERRSSLDVIVVNDGSKDGTSAVGHQYELRYPGIVRVVDKVNGGYGSTINASLDVAVGKYYKLLDGDDWVDAKALDKLIDALETLDVDIVLTPYNIVREESSSCEEVRVDWTFGSQTVSLLKVMTNEAFPMHALAYKTNLLVDNHVRITERCYYTDYEFTVKPMLYAETVLFVDTSVYQYRIGREGQSVSLDSIKRNIDMAITASLKLASFYEEEVKGSSADATKRNLLLRQVSSSTRNKYRWLFLLDSAEMGKAKIFDYDAKLRNVSSEVYRETVGTRKMRVILRLLRFGNGMLFPVIAHAVKSDYCK